jgi:DNA repair protein RadA/Sms
MPPKRKSVFVCSVCGAQAPKWVGQCDECESWNTLVESRVEPPVSKSRSSGSGRPVQRLDEIVISDDARFSSGESELDRVLGDGFVEGSVVLIGGDPGIGKSTLLLQSLAHLSGNVPVLYVTGEESTQQIALRARRLNVDAPALELLAENNLEDILACLTTTKPRVVVIDSIQTLYTEQLSSAPGSVAQVRETAAQLVRYAKREQTVLILIGHVTKGGALAGPRILEHMVDAVLYFEGDKSSRFRLIRAIKNRFGAVNEIGVFAMTEHGLRAVDNPSAMFVDPNRDPSPGRVTFATQEGNRPLLVEVQALVDRSPLSNPRRLTVGIDQARLSMLLAVLHRHGGFQMYDQDVFVNAVGGIKVSEPAADLAVTLAVVSSLVGKPLDQDLIVFGEVGLSGEVRPVQRGDDRLREAAKLGFRKAIIPKENMSRGLPAAMEIIAVKQLHEALALIRP